MSWIQIPMRLDVLVMVDDHHSLGKKDQEMLRKNQ
jgi:hypothetical protein